jgi:hypothetical protein
MCAHRVLVRSFAVITALSMAFDISVVSAQQGARDWSSYRPQITGRPWAVMTAPVRTVVGAERKWTVVTDFDTEAEAKSYAKYRSDLDNDYGRRYASNYFEPSKRENAAESSGATGSIDIRPQSNGTPSDTRTRHPILVKVYDQQGKYSLKGSLSSTDYDTANKYYWEVKGRKDGWTAVWDAPDWPAPKAQPGLIDLVGSGAKGTIGGATDVQGRTTVLIAEFKKGGVLLIKTGEDTKFYEGTWTQRGREVTMTAGASRFTGTIDGTQISGTRSRSGASNLVNTSDRWQLTIGR